MKIRNPGDWFVAAAVVACSAILLAALAMALSGTMLRKPDRAIRVNFHDVTGINMGAQVKYAGALAGRVSAIRMLTIEERTASGDPRNAVEVTLALNQNVPVLPSDVTASIAADTLLSDKFILLSAGSPAAPPLAENQILEGITPATFDELARNVNTTLAGLREIFGDTKAETGTVFQRLRAVLDEAGTLVTEARSLVTNASPVVGQASALIADARGVAGDAKSLITENREPIKRVVMRIDKAAGTLDALATRGNALIAGNERKLNDTLTNFKIVAENLKLTSAYTTILTRTLAQRPNRIIWGGRPQPLPTESEILQSQGPLPAN